MLLIENLIKKNSENFTLNIPTLRVGDGEIIYIFGDNGAGKTTLFKAILDLLKIDTGDIYINNINIRNDECWKNVTSSFLDETTLIDYLTPLEYIKFVLSIKNLNYSENSVPIFEIINDTSFIKNLSKGNKQKIGLISCLVQNSKLMILDEPFANIDLKFRKYLIDNLKNFATDRDLTIVFSSHEIDIALRLCTRVIILKDGKIIKDFQNLDYESTMVNIQDVT